MKKRRRPSLWGSEETGDECSSKGKERKKKRRRRRMAIWRFGHGRKGMSFICERNPEGQWKKRKKAEQSKCKQNRERETRTGFCCEKFMMREIGTLDRVSFVC